MVDASLSPPPAGHNRPPSSISERLAEDYSDLLASVEKLAVEANAAPKSIEDDDTSNSVADLIKSIAAAAKRAESTRVAEKEPHLQAGRDVDGFFKVRALDRLERMKTSLSLRVTDYLRRKAQEERRRREEEERLRREEAARALREAEERDRAARQAKEEEAALAAAEAAKAATASDFGSSTILAPIAGYAAAEQARANSALDDAAAADAAAQKAAREAAAKPADLARTRGEASLSTLKETWEFEIVDIQAIPLSVLRPFLPRPDIEKAVRAFVRVGHRELEGVRIYKVESAVIR